MRTPKAAVKPAPKAPELSTMKRAPKEAPMNTEERELLEAARLIAEAQKRSKMRRANLTKVRAPQFGAQFGAQFVCLCNKALHKQAVAQTG